MSIEDLCQSFSSIGKVQVKSFITLKDLNTYDYQWLTNTLLYKDISSSIEDSTDDEIITDVYCSLNEKNIREYLRVANYWGCYYLPEEFFNCLFYHRNQSIILLTELVYQTKCPKYEFLLFWLKNPKNENLLQIATEYRYNDIISYLCSKKRIFIF